MMTYDPDKVTVSFKSINLSGYADGDEVIVGNDVGMQCAHEQQLREPGRPGPHVVKCDCCDVKHAGPMYAAHHPRFAEPMHYATAAEAYACLDGAYQVTHGPDSNEQ